MMKIVPGGFRHIISGMLQILSLYTKAMGRFSEVVWYDLIITDRMGRLLSDGNAFHNPKIGGAQCFRSHTSALIKKHGADNGGFQCS